MQKRTRARSSSSTLSLEEFRSREHLTGDRTVDVHGTPVRLTHLERVYWPAEGITKHELLKYYANVWPRLGPFLENRPTILQRYPEGLASAPFFQHDLREGPPWLRRVRLVNREGRTLHYPVVRSLADLFFLVNRAALEQHPWLSTADEPDRPLMLAVDLDPGERVEWRRIEELALAVRDVLSSLRAPTFPKTSGSRGLHLFIPADGRRPFEELQPFCIELGRRIVDRLPSLATLERSLKRRDPSRIYVDLLQNARGKGIAAPYSVRVRPGAPVSLPLTWAQVEAGVEPRRLTIRSPLDVLMPRRDPWLDFFTTTPLSAKPAPPAGR